MENFNTLATFRYNAIHWHSYQLDEVAQDIGVRVEDFGPDPFEVVTFPKCHIVGCSHERGKPHVGQYVATIGNESWLGSFDDLSAVVYFEHYVPESLHSHDCPKREKLDFLVKVLDDYCRWQGIRYACAQELMHEVATVDSHFYGTFKVKEWLQWYIDQWDEYSECDALERDDTEFWIIKASYKTSATGRFYVDGPVKLIRRESQTHIPKTGLLKWLVEWPNETRTWEHVDRDHDDRDEAQRICDGYNSRG